MNWTGEWTADSATALGATSRNCYGSIYWATPAATANEAATPIKAAGTTAALGNAFLVTQATTNRLTYTGVATRDFHVTASISLSAGAATNATVHLAANGAIVTGAKVTRTIPNTDTGAMAVAGIISLAKDEYVELWCETDDGDDITIQSGSLTIISGVRFP
jgi:hypothetical protein